jgi:glutathione S-transferase
MQLYYSATSPFVRKCLVAAHELNLRGRIELVTSVPHPVNRDRALVAVNPLGKAPTLVTEAGVALYDSRVICEYLNALGDGQLLPASGAARWATLTDQALADGLMDAAVLVRYETVARPEALRWEEWVTGQFDKVTCALDVLERGAKHLSGRVDLGSISIACALAYLDFRYGTLGWRERCPTAAQWLDEFAQRESMRATQPPAA